MVTHPERTVRAWSPQAICSVVVVRSSSFRPPLRRSPPYAPIDTPGLEDGWSHCMYPCQPKVRLMDHTMCAYNCNARMIIFDACFPL